ncbi:hypothetical protein P167DRAFT_397282 [Morchella conica CCBAS932]|uniref:Uncharacterized protein n=1 Tax=Morchella conica CCBAS932 TaxID=1392247 RepID=A0A3N4KGV3_9PEZI|nr:hypothetical protein P167DRAFT_397282 [Morchella conica CCBAS932]
MAIMRVRTKGKGKKKTSEQDRPGPTAGCRTVNEIPLWGNFGGGNSTEMERSREAQSFEIATHPHYCTTLRCMGFAFRPRAAAGERRASTTGPPPESRSLSFMQRRLPLAGPLISILFRLILIRYLCRCRYFKF